MPVFRSHFPQNALPGASGAPHCVAEGAFNRRLPHFARADIDKRVRSAASSCAIRSHDYDQHNEQYASADGKYNPQGKILLRQFRAVLLPDRWGIWRKIKWFERHLLVQFKYVIVKLTNLLGHFPGRSPINSEENILYASLIFISRRRIFTGVASGFVNQYAYYNAIIWE